MALVTCHYHQFTAHLSIHATATCMLKFLSTIISDVTIIKIEIF